MAITAHVYQIYIKGTPDQVWSAITESEWTRRYFHATHFDAPLVEGEVFRMVRADDGPAVDGQVEQLQPPAPGRPGRLVVTWHVLYDADLSQEPPGRVEWTVEAVGDRLTRVRLVHGDLAFSPLTWENVRDGWVWVLDGLKTVIETGSSLPPVTRDGAADSSEAVDGLDSSQDWHRSQAVTANNDAWELLQSEHGLSPDEVEELLRRVYTAAYHWQRAAGAEPANESRASYLVAAALLLADQPEAALRAADRSLTTCAAAGLVDFDLAYAHEARARALAELGRAVEAEEAWALAREVEIADPEDREILERDFARRTPPVTRPAPTLLPTTPEMAAGQLSAQ
jgi:uncharacterized protein YndB with AHSA1/START domain